MKEAELEMKLRNNYYSLLGGALNSSKAPLEKFLLATIAEAPAHDIHQDVSLEK